MGTNELEALTSRMRTVFAPPLQGNRFSPGTPSPGRGGRSQDRWQFGRTTPLVRGLHSSKTPLNIRIFCYTTEWPGVCSTSILPACATDGFLQELFQGAAIDFMICLCLAGRVTARTWVDEAFGEEKAAWQIAPRTLPPPTGGSDEIRKSQSPASTRAQPQRHADN